MNFLNAALNSIQSFTYNLSTPKDAVKDTSRSYMYFTSKDQIFMIYSYYFLITLL
jgi:hypothetical protein